MIVVDTSALIAILDGEEDAALYADAISESDTPLISAAAMIETGIVMLRRHGRKGAHKAQTLIQTAGLQVESVTAHHAEMALAAYATYGKGGTKAGALNYGDSFSYALAKATGLPLLFKGDDFSKTDVVSAL